ncbi:MAG: protease pro-enzyme activation domain-containing protein, partial [Verrucomicrobiota bacterium]
MAIALIATAVFGVSAAQAQTAAGRVDLAESIREVATTLAPVNGPERPTIARATLRAQESATPMEFAVALRMRNFAELQARIGHGERVGPAEMAEKFLPLATDYDAAAAWLEGQGLTVTRRDSSRLAVFVRGTVEQVRRTFQVTFARVRFRGEEHTSALTAPSVPAEIAPAILGINGLQPHLHPQAHTRRLQPNPNSTTGNVAPFLPSQIAKAYNALPSNLGFDGTGQTIGVVIDTFPLDSDLTAFWALCGVPQSLNNIQKIAVVSGVTQTANAEASLDVEWSSSIAPGAKVRIYGTSNLSFANLDQAYAQIYNDVVSGVAPTLHQLSLSYGLGEIYST